MENSSSQSVTDNACEFNGTSVQENWAQSDGVRAYGVQSHFTHKLWCRLNCFRGFFFLVFFFTLMENGVIYILLALKIWILIHITWWDAHALTTQALYVWWGVDWTFFDVIFILNQSIKFNRHINFNNCLNVLPNSSNCKSYTNVMHRQYSG